MFLFSFFSCWNANSTESGQDNPFRPDGDLSREADELVELLKGGRPISEVLKSQEDGQRHLQEQHDERRESDAEPPEATESTPLAGAATPSPVKAGAATPSDARAASPRANNGSVGETAEKGAADEGVVEVQRVAAPAPVESQAEHVVIKKKSNCNCCVLQ